ncbi:hypothetical protein [Phaeobacter sp. 11ANDIMAR09]|uniref:hypothetical protein n=1 Tax=Phaeobacter sp. 11ANDIMAR09 TaxID=1225647 RepID=UPI0006C89374|nr:hypothetical protein [Phaeobacter sp. 11ANDIMAR09]
MTLRLFAATRNFEMNSRIVVGRLLILLGLFGGFVSVWYTLNFTWNPQFQSVNLPDAPTHSNYHAFRGAMLALAANLLLFWAAFKARALSPEVWSVVTFVAVFYYLGWWAAWPIWGLHAPSFVAEMNHVIGTVGGLGGLLFLQPRKTV